MCKKTALGNMKEEPGMGVPVWLPKLHKESERAVGGCMINGNRHFPNIFIN